jgi:hypothetical protein
MAIQYSFFIDTGLAPEQLMRTMLLALGVPWNPDDGCMVDTPSFSAGAAPFQGRSREIFRADFGFDANQFLNFRTRGEAAYNAEHEIVRGTLAICRAVTGDAILLFNGETVLFMRKEGTLYVNSEWWKGNYVLFDPPYVVQAFPAP